MSPSNRRAVAQICGRHGVALTPLVLVCILTSITAVAATVSSDPASAPLLFNASSLPHPLSLEEHHVSCGFDVIEAKTTGTRISSISSVRAPPERQREVTPAAAADVADWAPIRIRAFTGDVDDPTRHCTEVGQSRSDLVGGQVVCTADDILTLAKRDTLKKLLLPSAIRLHKERLSVLSVSGNVVVDPSIASDSLCSLFSIPAAHTRTGVSGVDFILYLSAVPTSGSMVAWASTCQYFSNGRPAVGVVNISPRFISADLQVVRVVAHELLHALGFNDNTFQSHRMITSKRLRDKGYAPVITSANVAAMAKAQYGCKTQNFMELEDAGGPGTTRSHWKRRSAKDELMAGTAGAGYYTALTIAAMEDMGFYKGIYDKAERMAFGQGVGCSLATSQCLVDGVSQHPNMFCNNTSSVMSCTSSHDAIGICHVNAYRSALPPYFRYFADPKLGGGDPLMDYCPYILGYSNANCNFDAGLLLGNTYGTESRCFNVPAGFVQGGRYISSQHALCASVSCGASIYEVKVAGASAYTVCQPGESIELATLSSNFTKGRLVCPTYDAVCAGWATATEYENRSSDEEDGDRSSVIHPQQSSEVARLAGFTALLVVVLTALVLCS